MEKLLKPQSRLVNVDRQRKLHDPGTFDRQLAQQRTHEALGWKNIWRRDAMSPPFGSAAYFAYRTQCAVKALADVVDFDPERRGGSPVLKRTRFKVSQLIAQLADGDSVDSLVDELELDADNVRQFLHALSVILDRPGNR